MAHVVRGAVEGQHQLVHQLRVVLGRVGGQGGGHIVVKPQLQARLQLLTGVGHAENGPQHGQQNGAGHAHKGRVERDAHAAERGHEAAAHAVEHVQPLGRVGAQQLGQGADGERQAQERAEQAQRYEQRNGVIQEAFTQKAPAELRGHAVCDDGGGVDILAVALVGVGVVVDHIAQKRVVALEIAHL